jgi:hypothetical protein
MPKKIGGKIVAATYSKYPNITAKSPEGEARNAKAKKDHTDTNMVIKPKLLLTTDLIFLLMTKIPNAKLRMAVVKTKAVLISKVNIYKL